MDTRVGWWLLLAAVVLAPALAAQAGDTTDTTSEAEPTLIRTETGVRVDATGHVTAVELDPELPAALRNYAGKMIRSWTFAPVMQDGQAVGGKTYADVHLCLVPSGDHFNVGFDFAGNGPGNAGDDPRARIPPFPFSLIRSHADLEVEARVRYRVGADGHAKLVSATFDDPQMQQRHGRSWRRQVHEWLRTRHFKPEIIDGQPVATTMELPIQFKLSPSGSIDDRRDEHMRQLAETEACQVAAGASEQREVAMDSRFVLLRPATKPL